MTYPIIYSVNSSEDPQMNHLFICSLNELIE
jgi:hypothetical protein